MTPASTTSFMLPVSDAERACGLEAGRVTDSKACLSCNYLGDLSMSIDKSPSQILIIICLNLMICIRQGISRVEHVIAGKARLLESRIQALKGTETVAHIDHAFTATLLGLLPAARIPGSLRTLISLQAGTCYDSI